MKSPRWHNLWRLIIVQFLRMLRKVIPGDLPGQPIVLAAISWVQVNPMNNTHMTVRYKNLGIQQVCPTEKFPALQAKIGTNGGRNKTLSIKHILDPELLLHERRPLNEIIQAGLAEGADRGAEGAVAEEEVVEQFLWDNPHL